MIEAVGSSRTGPGPPRWRTSAGASHTPGSRSDHRSARPVREIRQSQTRLSVSNRAELIDGYVVGVPVRELAKRFNVHRGAVREIARQAGLAARYPELADAIRPHAARLYAVGLTPAQLAMPLGSSAEAALSAVVACGAP